MRLLLAEDDAALGRATCLYMMRDGHPVDWVTNGNQLLELSGKFEYDCVILDLGLPELSGNDCLVNLRAHNNATPVIITTAQGARDLRVKLLDIGADDYLLKPYDLAELSARVKAIVRRSRPSENIGEASRTFGPLTLMPASNSVLWHGAPVVLIAPAAAGWPLPRVAQAALTLVLAALVAGGLGEAGAALAALPLIERGLVLGREVLVGTVLGVVAAVARLHAP